jgi:hypothetical protein
MTLPVGGSISMGQVNTEFLRSATATVSLNDTDLRALFVKVGAATTNSLNDGRSKAYYAIGTVSAHGFTNYGSSGLWYVTISGANPYAVITAQLTVTDSGQPLGTTSLGTCDASGNLSFSTPISGSDPYWYPAPIYNEFIIWQDGTHSLGTFVFLP